MADSVTHWLNTASRYPLLTPAQEVHAGQAVRRWWDWPNGKNKAPKAVQRAGKRGYDKLFSCNLRLVSNVAKRYLPHTTRTSNFGHEDLLQVGAIGLMRAVEKFDPAKGYKFSTYSYWWIQQGMQRLCEKTTVIHINTMVCMYRRWVYRRRA